MAETISSITAALFANGKTIYPNPATYTAATAIIIGMSEKIAPSLVLFGRLEAWTEILNDELKA